MFIDLVGVDGNHRAFHVDDVRILSDQDHEEGVESRLKVTLCDGTEFMAKGDVASVLKIIEKLESR